MEGKSVFLYGLSISSCLDFPPRWTVRPESLFIATVQTKLFQVPDTTVAVPQTWVSSWGTEWQYTWFAGNS